MGALDEGGRWWAPWLKKTCGKPAGRKRKRKRRESAPGGAPIHFPRYHEWLPRFFTKLIECSSPLRTMRQLPVKLSSGGNADAPSPAEDNIKSASIWQNSRFVIALIRCTFCQPSFPVPLVLSTRCSRISPDHPFPFLRAALPFPSPVLYVSVYRHSCGTGHEHICTHVCARV